MCKKVNKICLNQTNGNNTAAKKAIRDNTAARKKIEMKLPPRNRPT
jgi:hypothetical protein